jgi:hypothetical protein
MLEFISFLILFASLVIIICLFTFLYGNRLIEPIFNKLNLRFCTLLTLSLNCFTWFCISWSEKILKVLLGRPFASEAFLCLTAFLLGLSLPINVRYSKKHMKIYGDHAKTRKGKLKLVTITVGPIIASMITSHILNLP